MFGWRLMWGRAYRVAYFLENGVERVRIGRTLSAKGAHHYSLGQRPRERAQRRFKC